MKPKINGECQGLKGYSIETFNVYFFKISKFLLPIVLNILLYILNTPSLQEVIILFGVVNSGKQYEI